MKQKFKVSCESFKENCAQNRKFSKTPFNMRGDQWDRK